MVKIESSPACVYVQVQGASPTNNNILRKRDHSEAFSPSVALNGGCCFSLPLLYYQIFMETLVLAWLCSSQLKFFETLWPWCSAHGWWPLFSFKTTFLWSFHSIYWKRSLNQLIWGHFPLKFLTVDLCLCWLLNGAKGVGNLFRIQ